MTIKKYNITSDHILGALMDRHTDDISIAEPLLGGSGSMRMDYWAMTPSWSNRRCIGYEIKVTRSDFLRDKKWEEYLPFTTEFYFVCPAKIIALEELPKEVGLMYCSATGTRLITKRKAVKRKLDPMSFGTILQHILMWRYEERNQKRTAAWWKEQLKERRELDWEIKRYIQKKVDKEVKEIWARNEVLKQENDNVRDIKAWAERQGLDLSTWSPLSELKKMCKAMEHKGLTQQDREMLRSSIRALTKVADEFGVDLKKKEWE